MGKKEEVISLLLRLGWEEDGVTVQQTARIPTTNPVLGQSGGELVVRRLVAQLKGIANENCFGK